MQKAETGRDSFFQRVYEIVASIPQGRVMSYGQIAKLLGAPKMARQVGWAMRACRQPLPWHRVVNRLGGVIPSETGARLQTQLLAAEGVGFDKDGRVRQEFFCIPTVSTETRN